MLACSNAECSRRFCEHCLLTHLSEDVDPSCSDAWVHVAGVAGKQFKLYEGVMKALIRRYFFFDANCSDAMGACCRQKVVEVSCLPNLSC